MSVDDKAAPRQRTLAELVNRDEPGMDLVRTWMPEARNTFEVLPTDPGAGERTLLALQITTRSPMGAIAFETGGILIDHGWLRILGAKAPAARATSRHGTVCCHQDRRIACPTRF